MFKTWLWLSMVELQELGVQSQRRTGEVVSMYFESVAALKQAIVRYQGCTAYITGQDIPTGETMSAREWMRRQNARHRN